ncbi:uncharacterized protein LOC117173901 [Belonocnema kinseyi]|uniref:uncharacterized protein LOC117173901 n=1 Tax=Belonocnema kinseyi TaxID=2817044 RepID=UPI00143CD17A|nr:uncharacterized protein LOC117173901 [Belonocnema kinseyi]
MERFCPNECCVCKSANNIKRCARCQMISYCGKDHQHEHWKYHKDICKIIYNMMKEENVSHLFEKLRGSDLPNWIERRIQIAEQVEEKLGRSLRREELGMFKFPRVCFVCHDTRPEKLNRCLGCSAANFCSEHPSSLIHDRVCSILKNRIDWVIKNHEWDPVDVKPAIAAIGSGTIFPKSGDSPTSMGEFMNLYTKPKIELSEKLKNYLTEMFTISLTLFSALQTLSDPPSSEIVLHVDAGSFAPLSAIFLGNYWEVLLHLLPNTKILKIVHPEAPRTHKEEIPLCKKCRCRKRRLFVEAHLIPYERYLQQPDYQKPNILAYLNVDPPEKYDYVRQIWERRFVRMSKVTCPMLMTTLTERGAFLVREIITTSTTNFVIIHDGYNNFAPQTYIKEFEDGTLRRNSQYMIVFQHQEAEFVVLLIRK